MTEKEIKIKLSEAYKKSLNTKRKCIVENCQLPAIHSHLLQKNGVLNQLSIDNHVYLVEFLNFPKPHFSIIKKGIRKGFTFKGFCEIHDGKIFKEIETGVLDVNDYKTFLLLSYRAIVKEYRAKEAAIDFYSAVKKSNFRIYFNSLEIQDKIIAETYVSWDLEFLYTSIQNDLKNPAEENFTFEFIIIPKIEICTSATYSLTSLMDSCDFFTLEKKKLIPSLIVNILPYTDKTIFILGYHNESKNYCRPVVSEFLRSDEASLKKKISDLLLKNLGTWMCSEKFYNSHIKNNVQTIENIMNHYTGSKIYSSELVNFNLFDHPHTD